LLWKWPTITLHTVLQNHWFGSARTATSMPNGSHFSAICEAIKAGGFPPRPIVVSAGELYLIKNWMRVGLVAIVATVFVSGSDGQEATFNLPGMGGFAVSPDSSTLVVSLTAKTELVFIDALAGKETKRVTVEFQPTQMVWSDKVIFVAQKSSGKVHIVDAESGKELAEGNASGPVRNLAVAKGICFASTGNREVYAIDAKGTSTKTSAQGTFIAADPKGAFVCTVIDGKATTDVYKYMVNGTELGKTDKFFRAFGASLLNVQGAGISGDGKQFAVVAGAGWSDLDKRRHYSVPLYSADDMTSQLGELETGAYPCGVAMHPVLPLMFACTGKEGSVFSAKSYAASQKFPAPRQVQGAAWPSVLAFVGKGQKLAWGTSDAKTGVLKLYDLQLTKDQQAQLNKAFPVK
jgi:hypothetical protein